MTDILFIQSADTGAYAEMLDVTAQTVLEHCRRTGAGYESYKGIKRGVWPWQATYNRLFQLVEIARRGFRGWVVHLDADAYVVDLDFDLKTYLADKGRYAAVLTPSMATDHHWDINAGVCLFNLDHEVGRYLVERWLQRMDEQLPDARLRAAEKWLDDDSDQDLIQQILMQEPDVSNAVHLQSTELMNSSFASYIRQQLRGYNDSFEARMAAIVAAVSDVMGRPIRTPSMQARMPTPDRIRRDAEAEVVAALYATLLGREPDAEGAIAAQNHLAVFGIRDGLQSLIPSILDSAEYRQRAAR